MEMNSNVQIGLGLTAFGLVFIFLGIVFLFDKGLLAIGNLMFISGLSLLIGFRKTFSFFFQREKLKGSLAFFAGIIVLLSGHPIIGAMIELIGIYLLFKSFLPAAFSYITSYVPFFNVVSRARSIV